MKKNFSRLDILNILAINLYLVVISLFALKFVDNQFGGYDLSPLIDLFWRLELGQIPNKDFVTTFPIIFIVLAKLNSYFNHINWDLFTWINIFVSFLILNLILIQALLFKFKNYLVLWILGIGISIPLIYTNHIWHSSISSVIAINFVFNIYLIVLNRRVGSSLILFTSTFLLVMTKQNLGPPLLVMTLVLSVFLLRNLIFRLMSLILSGIFFGIFFTLIFTKMDFAGLGYLYFGASSRIVPSTELINAIRSLTSFKITAIVICLLLLLSLIKFYKSTSHRALMIFPLTYLILSFIPLWTDWDSKINNLPLVIACSTLTICNLNPQFLGSSVFEKNINLINVMAVIILLHTAISYGSDRERMRAVGDFFESPANNSLNTRLFSNLKTGDRFSGIMSEIKSLEFRTEAKIYFGPRMEWAYFESRLNSPMHVPLYWLPGTSYALKDEKVILQNIKSSKFDFFIFVKGDRTYLPAELTSYLDRNYEASPSFSFIDVYLRR
jgi:hypothetical protein